METRFTHRPLRVYAFDPSQGRGLGNFMTVKLPYEQLQPGPSGAYISVIDYDAANGVYYQPVDLNDFSVLLYGGLAPTELDPRFHQQMVYAVARETMHHFERALGRRLKWGFHKREPLRIFPHAMQEANAYYDRNVHGILFGYFAASAEDPGRNLPGQTIYTCLSHDIIAHETTHAILDGQRPNFMQDTNADVPAFHEAFADVVALFQHFSYREALRDTMIRTGGQLFRDRVDARLPIANDGDAVVGAQLGRNNPLIDLARQFGESTARRGALRSALGTKPNTRALDFTSEPHERGSILVAAIFDAYFTALQNRTADLYRIARAGGASVTTNELHPDLAERLCDEAAKTAEHFLTLCIRAIDYCPPVDITFGDYLRALITADTDVEPEDRHDYREALIEAFRSRGITIDSAASLSQDALRWRGVSVAKGEREPCCEPLTFDLNSEDPRKDENYRRVWTFAQEFWRPLRLAEKYDSRKPGNIACQVQSVIPVVRSVEGRARIEIVAEIVQRDDIRLDPNDDTSPLIRVYGGSTVHLNYDGSVRYIIHRSLDDDERLSKIRDYWQTKRAGNARLTYVTDDAIDTTLKFCAVHRGL
ncbi:MAG: peptidase M4 [Acidobacteria bacterium]|nr:peptidase M4 [Acidobacteriota bacterium]MBV9478857.1 peptidase M4 [Acidobacteriota bacterium]